MLISVLLVTIGWGDLHQLAPWEELFNTNLLVAVLYLPWYPSTPSVWASCVGGIARGASFFLSISTPLNLTILLLFFHSSTWWDDGDMGYVYLCVSELVFTNMLPISNLCTHNFPGPGPSYLSSNFFSSFRANSTISSLWYSGYFFFHTHHYSRPSYFSLSVFHTLNSGVSFAAFLSSLVAVRIFFFVLLIFLGRGVFFYTVVVATVVWVAVVVATPGFSIKSGCDGC